VPEYPEGYLVGYREDLGTFTLGRMNLLLEESAGQAVADDVAAAVGGKVVGAFGLIGLYQVQLPDDTAATLDAAIETAGAIAGVVGAAADVEAHMLGAACESTSPLNSPSYQQGDNAAHYAAIGVQEAWDIITASRVELSDVRVGVVDTFFMPVSTEDEGDVNIETPRGTTDQPSVDDNGVPDMGNLNHGTAVTHVIAADGDNGGVVGVASPLGSQLTVTVDNIFDGSRTYEVDEADAANPTHTPDGHGGAVIIPTMEKILRQVEDGATVVNMSFGPDEPSGSWRFHADAYRRFFTAMSEKYPNVVFVAAAGNEAGSLDGNNYFPGGLNLPNVITVAAVDETGAAASFTNTTSGNGEITIAAPGVDVPLGVDPVTDQVFTDSGTSFAAPMVAGAIALIQSINPELTAAEIRQLLVDTARDGVAARGDAGTSTLIPGSVGGKIMRVDDAVLAAINGVRAAADPPQAPLDKDSLLAGAAFTVDASRASFGVYEIAAGVDGEQSGTMSFELFDEGSVSGSSTQTASSSSPATWEVTPADPAGVASGKVCRTDAARCCVVTLESISIAGTYSGGLTIGYVEASGDLVVDTPDGEQVVTKDECDELYTEVVGKSFSVEITLSDDGSGTSGAVAAVVYDLDGAPFDTTPATWAMSGSNVTIPLSFVGDGFAGVFVLDGTVVFDDDGAPQAIAGGWVMTGVANLTLGGDFTMSLTG
jgi:hypothetical protein